MSATEKPVTELTPKTSITALAGKAVVIYDKTTGDADSIEGETLKTSLEKADSAYQKPGSGIPKSDLSSGVQVSLDKADSAVQDVSGKADKDTDAVEGNLAEFDANGNPVDSGIPSTKIGEIDDKVTELGNSAGIAEGIADTVSAGTPQEIVFRKSGGDGVNYVKRFKGRTLAWNQLVENGNFESNTRWVFDGSGSVSNNEATIAPTSSVTGAYQNSIPTINGHKYLIRTYVKVSKLIPVRAYFGKNEDNGIIIPITTANQYVKGIGIVHASKNATLLQINVYGLSAGETISIKKVNLIDLTLMFGAGNEPSSVAEFEALYPESYYPYNAGTLISNDASAL